MVAGARAWLAGFAACCVRAGRACGVCVAGSAAGRSARPGVPLLARGVAAEVSAGGPRQWAWRTEWLRTCEFQKRKIDFVLAWYVTNDTFGRETSLQAITFVRIPSRFAGNIT